MDYYSDNHTAPAHILCLRTGMGSKSRIGFFLAVLLLIVSAFPCSASTPDGLAVSLRFTIENAPVAGASFICRRAGSYSDFPEVRQGTAEQVLKEIAAEEAKAGSTPGEAPGDRICQTGKTGKNGELQFSGLPEGVYVIEGEDVLLNNYIYTPQPFLISARDPDTEEPVIAQIKYERTGKDSEKPDPNPPRSTIAKPGKKLPQTGLQWNLVRLVSGAGLLLILLGTVLRASGIKYALQKRQPDH